MVRELLAQIPSTTYDAHGAIIDSHYLQDIPDAFAKWGCERILLVVSKTMDATTSIVKDLELKLGSKVVDKKQGVGSHSPYADVIDIAHRIQDLNIDGIASIGSSSYSDATKIGNLLASTLQRGFQDEDMEALVDAKLGVTPDEKIKAPAAKLICVPTSLSASEWNWYSSCTNKKGKKQHYGHPDAAPDLILLDTTVAKTSPQSLWISSGIRAIDHCVEAICRFDCKLQTAERSLKGLRALITGLKDYHGGKSDADVETLDKGIIECFIGSRYGIMGYVVDGNRFGPSHAIGHQLGSVAGVQHGVTSCICLGPVLRFMQQRSVEAQQSVLAAFNESLGWQESSAGDAFTRFARELGMPTKLSEVGVTEQSQIDKIADMTLTDIIGHGPGSLSRDEVLRVLDMAR